MKKKLDINSQEYLTKLLGPDVTFVTLKPLPFLKPSLTPSINSPLQKHYFIIYDLTHGGWQAEMIDSQRAQEITEDEDNMDIFVCYTYDSVTWEYLIPLDENPTYNFLEPWKEHKVNAKIVKGEIHIDFE